MLSGREEGKRKLDYGEASDFVKLQCLKLGPFEAEAAAGILVEEVW